ncbi:hypothetical protein TNCV_1714801 [Trichonephila clavipes]|nr:hypothetical protein TNCV_1714801 [Trichonephila clavipes]
MWNRKKLLINEKESLPALTCGLSQKVSVSSEPYECVSPTSWTSTIIAKLFETANCIRHCLPRTATAGSDVVQSGRPIFDDFFQHLWPYIGNNTANVVFQIVKRLWLIRIDQ